MGHSEESNPYSTSLIPMAIINIFTFFVGIFSNEYGINRKILKINLSVMLQASLQLLVKLV
jgi:hypothetical protein